VASDDESYARESAYFAARLKGSGRTQLHAPIGCGLFELVFAMVMSRVNQLWLKLA
jgi:hypothetical protein